MTRPSALRTRIPPFGMAPALRLGSLRGWPLRTVLCSRRARCPRPLPPRREIRPRPEGLPGPPATDFRGDPRRATGGLRSPQGPPMQSTGGPGIPGRASGGPVGILRRLSTGPQVQWREPSGGRGVQPPGSRSSPRIPAPLATSNAFPTATRTAPSPGHTGLTAAMSPSLSPVPGTCRRECPGCSPPG